MATMDFTTKPQALLAELLPNREYNTHLENGHQNNFNIAFENRCCQIKFIPNALFSLVLQNSIHQNWTFHPHFPPAHRGTQE